MKTFSRPNLRREEAKSKHRLNHQIKVPEIRLIDQDGKMVGVVTVKDALRMAEVRELDLVEISPNAKPPVCKILDYSKFLYDQQKREKAQKRQQQAQQMKELRFTWRTAQHDFNFKAKHAREFLEEGNKVKATVMFRGREITHQEVGEELLKRFIEELEDISKVDSPIKLEGRKLNVILSPDKTKMKKTAKDS